MLAEDETQPNSAAGYPRLRSAVGVVVPVACIFKPPVFEEGAHVLVGCWPKATNANALFHTLPDRESIAFATSGQKAFRYCRASQCNLSAVGFAGGRA